MYVRRSAATALAKLAALGLAFALGACSSTKASAGSPLANSPAVIVVAQDFRYIGIPASVRAGRSTWTLRNSGRQPHELALIEIDPGHTLADLQKTLARSGPPLWAHPTGGIQPTAPDATQTELMYLKPGHYVAVCMIPDPATSQPHAAMGMVTEFEVL